MLRKLIFWPHLVVGIVTGIVVFMLCLTGAAITFDKQIVTWVEMDGNAGPPSADSRRLPPEVLAARRARLAHARILVRMCRRLTCVAAAQATLGVLPRSSSTRS